MPRPAPRARTPRVRVAWAARRPLGSLATRVSAGATRLWARRRRRAVRWPGRVPWRGPPNSLLAWRRPRHPCPVSPPCCASRTPRPTATSSRLCPPLRGCKADEQLVTQQRQGVVVGGGGRWLGGGGGVNPAGLSARVLAKTNSCILSAFLCCDAEMALNSFISRLPDLSRSHVTKTVLRTLTAKSPKRSSYSCSSSFGDFAQRDEVYRANLMSVWRAKSTRDFVA